MPSIFDKDLPRNQARHAPQSFVRLPNTTTGKIHNFELCMQVDSAVAIKA